MRAPIEDDVDVQKPVGEIVQDNQPVGERPQHLERRRRKGGRIGDHNAGLFAPHPRRRRLRFPTDDLPCLEPHPFPATEMAAGIAVDPEGDAVRAARGGPERRRQGQTSAADARTRSACWPSFEKRSSRPARQTSSPLTARTASTTRSTSPSDMAG